MSLVGPIRKIFNRYLAIIVLATIFSATATAYAAATLTVTPSTNLTNGQTVQVSATGLVSGAIGGAIQECNDAGGQPYMVVYGNDTPVGCTNPLSNTVLSISNGSFGPQAFKIIVGTVGPPASGKDSAGNSGATDAAKYPCPPTAAQIKAGVVCQIDFGDTVNGSAQSDNLSVNISFESTTPSSTSKTSTTPSHTNTTPAAGTSHTSTTSGQSNTGSSSSSSSELANTGPGSVALVASIIAAVVGAAMFLRYLLYKARR